MKKIVPRMNGIEWIYMIDSRSSSLLIFNNENKESLKQNKIPLLHFLYGLQSLASKFNKDEIKFIKISNESYYLIEEPISKSFFILKSVYKVKQKRIFQILKEIEAIFTKYFNGTDMISLSHKQELFNSFKEEIMIFILQNKYDGKNKISHEI